MAHRATRVTTRAFGIFGVVGMVFAAGAVAAQETPGTVLDTLQPRPELMLPGPAPVITPPAATAPAPASGQKTVVVSNFRFQGNTRFSEAELNAAVASYLNRAITLDDLYAATDALARRYQRAGYSLASVSVPPQTIRDGAVLLQVSEGMVGRVSVERAGGYSDERLSRTLNMAPGVVYEARQMESGMLRLNDLPGLGARAILRPGEAVGTTDILLRTEERRLQGYAALDNHGRKNVGELRASGVINLNNPLGWGDRLGVVALVSEQSLLTYFAGEYGMPIGYAGTRISVNYGVARFEVENIDGLEGENRSGRVKVEHPFIRTRARNLSGSLAVHRTLSSSDILGLRLSDLALTVMELSGQYSQVFPTQGIFQANLGVASNFKEQDRVNDPDGQMLKLTVDLQHLLPLAQRLQLYGRVEGVYSPDPLPDTSKANLGGPNSVRGYPASEFRGDRSIFGTVALRVPMQVGSISVTPRLFLDAGTVYRLDVAADGPRARDSLSSAGIGLDAGLPGGFSFRLDIAAPLEASDHVISDGRDDVRAFGALAYSF